MLGGSEFFQTSVCRVKLFPVRQPGFAQRHKPAPARLAQQRVVLHHVGVQLGRGHGQGLAPVFVDALEPALVGMIDLGVFALLDRQNLLEMHGAAARFNNIPLGIRARTVLGHDGVLPVGQV